MDYIIKKCTENDLSKLVELCGKHSDFEKAVYDPTGKVSLLKKALFSLTPSLYCYLIECNSTPQGYFTFTIDFSTWDASTYLHLDCLYLEPSFRGYGIGEDVFEKLKEIAKLHNCTNIQWQTPDFNVRAQKFYNRIGGKGTNKVRFFLDPFYLKSKV
jgi:GNAT superfamily N-acetyltransferase